MFQENIQIVYTAIVSFILALMYKFSVYLEDESDKALTKMDVFRLAVVMLIYGIFGAVLGVIVFLGFTFHFQDLMSNPQMQLLAGGVSGMVGTLGTTGVRILHMFAYRKAKNA